MAEVDIEINGRKYKVTCEDGQEERLGELSQYLDRHVGALVDELGQIGEARLLLLSALTVCDQLYDARQRLAEIAEGAGVLDAATVDGANQAVDAARRRIENLATRMAEAG